MKKKMLKNVYSVEAMFGSEYFNFHEYGLEAAVVIDIFPLYYFYPGQFEY